MNKSTAKLNGSDSDTYDQPQRHDAVCEKESEYRWRSMRKKTAAAISDLSLL